MSRSFIQLVSALVVGSLGAAAPTVNYGSAQNAPMPTALNTVTKIGLRLVATLQAPDYNNETAVGRHSSFTTVLALLLKGAYDAEPQAGCELRVDFAYVELRFQVQVPFREAIASWQQCAPRISTLLKTKEFDEAAFDIAAKKAIHISRGVPGALFESYATSDPATRRLGILAEMAVRKLYDQDSTIKPLREGYEWQKREANNYNGFKDWLARQRNSDQFGYFRSASGDARFIGILDLPPSSSSSFLMPRHLVFDYSKGLSVNSSRFRGHSIIMVRCDISRDPNCAEKTKKVLCDRADNQAIESTQAERSYFRTTLKCTIPSYAYVRFGWVAADADDRKSLEKRYEELPAGGLRTPEFEAALAEDVLFVTAQ